MIVKSKNLQNYWNSSITSYSGAKKVKDNMFILIEIQKSPSDMNIARQTCRLAFFKNYYNYYHQF